MIVRVGIPSYSGRVFPETWATMQKLASYSGDVVFDVAIIPNLSTYQARNLAVSRGNLYKKQKHAFDYFLSCDADNYFNVSDILMLIDREKDIVSGAYRIRDCKTGTLENRYVAGRWETPGIMKPENWIKTTARGLVKVDTAGLGCMLIRRNVLETLEYPYFRANVADLGGGMADLMPDDYSFSINAAAAGFNIYLDADVLIGHNCGQEER